MFELYNLLKLRDTELKEYLYKHLKEIGMDPVSSDGYLYAKGDIPILLVSHMDTVFDNPPEELLYSAEEGIIYSPTSGIGGDDRCGVYGILEILKECKPHVLFTEDEEIGCIGAMKAVSSLEEPDVKYIIELDRKGNNDCVFYDCANKKFIDYVKSFNFCLREGSFSDICILSGAWDIASVNLSCGYYNEHTNFEYINFNELTNNIERVKHMLNDHINANYFSYEENKSSYIARLSAHNYRRIRRITRKLDK